jgi:predicted TIM-barrel fold metal-dependent hydrolase
MIDGFKIIDAHMHYGGIFMQKNENLIQFMDRNGIDAAIVNTLNTDANMANFMNTPPGELKAKIMDPNFNLFENFQKNGQPEHAPVYRLAKTAPSRIYPFFWYNPADPTDSDPLQTQSLAKLQASIEQGCRGVKLQLAMTHCESARLIPVAKFCADNDLPLYVHLSAGVFGATRTETWEIIDLAAQFPKLSLIIGHAAYSMEFCIEVIGHAMGLDNVYFETSTSIPFGIAMYAKIFGADHVLFGSDTPPAGPFHIEYEKIKALNFSKEEKQLILAENITRLLKISLV